MEPLQTDTLYLAATRPAMFMGVPLALGAIFLMIDGAHRRAVQKPALSCGDDPDLVRSTGAGGA